MRKLHLSCAVAAALAACLPRATMADPSISCGDAARVGSALYDRTMEGHRKKYYDRAKFVAESFWRVADLFKDCSQVKELGNAMSKQGYPPSTRGEYSTSSGIGATISATVGSTTFSELPIAVGAGGGVSVVNGKTVPDTMMVGGVPFKPAASPVRDFAAAKGAKGEAMGKGSR